jgi:hypothetical protein
MHLRRAFANADGQNSADSSRTGAAQHFHPVFRIPRTIYMCMGIDQQWSLGKTFKLEINL